MESSICLIRHGITEGNKNRLYYGFSDVPLADEGIDELTKLAQAGIYPYDEEADFYTTGLKRTEQTLSLIYGEKDHLHIEEMREINFGNFEMKSHDDLRELEDYKVWKKDVSGNLAPPGGESLAGFSKRVLKGFEILKNRHALKELSMRHSGKKALSVMVCHGGSISAVLNSIYPEDGGNFYRWIPNPGHGYILTLEDGIFSGWEKF